MIISRGKSWSGNIRAAALVILLALPVPALAMQELVVVRHNGQTSSHVAKSGAAAAGVAACADPAVAFAFMVEPHDGMTTVQLQRGADVSRDIVLDVTLTCSTLEGSALVPFDAAGGTASNGSDYVSTPGMALLTLTHSDQGGVSTPVPAIVHIELLDNGQNAGQTRTLNIVRTEGSFQGTSAQGQPIVGTIPGSTTAIVAITILAQTTIDDGSDVVPGLDPGAGDVSNAATRFCADQGGGSGSTGCLATQVAANLVADPNTPASVRENATAVLENNLLAISPDETTALAFVAPLLATGQFDNLAERLSELRTGNLGGTVSAGGLTFVHNGLPFSLASLGTSLNVDDDESARNEEKRTLLGGTRLGLWVNGTIGGSETDRRGGNSGFKSDNWNLTSGLYYRFSDRFFAGAAIGYSSLTSDYANDQGSLDADSKSLHVYSGYALTSGFSLDGSVSYMRSDYTQKRVIELYALNAGGTGYSSLGRDIAVGKPRVTQTGANFSVTYTFMRGTWTIAPQAQISVLHNTYDAFSERGPSAFNLSFDERKSNSTSFSAGGYVDRTFATSVGAFRPYVRAYYFADSGSSSDLLSRFVRNDADGSATPIALSMQEPDRRYGTAELGLGFSRPIGTRTVDFSAGYMKTFSFQDLDRWALRFDMRIPL
jgi:outer membrane autotransporter protein